MNNIKTFENFQSDSILIIIDVSKSFRKYFTEMYVHELQKYCESFNSVYQIFDNHVDGKNVDKDYLYDKNPKIPVNDDLYFFKNQRLLIEKRYNYDVDVTFFKKILDEKTYNMIKYKEDNNLLKIGEYFTTKYGTIIVYIKNNHNWFHVGIKLYNFLQSLKGKEVVMVGGSETECYRDILVTSRSLGVIVKENHKFIYSATHCPIPI